MRKLVIIGCVVFLASCSKTDSEVLAEKVNCGNAQKKVDILADRIEAQDSNLVNGTKPSECTDIRNFSSFASDCAMKNGKSYVPRPVFACMDKPE